MLCIGRTPPPEIVIPESTLGPIGVVTDPPGATTDPVSGVKGSDNDDSGVAPLKALCHLILFTTIMVTLLL